MAPDPRDPKRDRAPIPGPAEFMGIGFQFVAAILIFLYVGRWLDARLGTSPWLLILGVFTGFGAAMYSMVQKLNRRGGPPKRGPEDGR
ncbi:MAG: AtpZ/AtpI family protein [Gemmatimonadetes bacterium]|nr:AtpZ/AtpI family protein [Gemmatimonadota bacterium]